jgi:hypothetical protein
VKRYVCDCERVDRPFTGLGLLSADDGASPSVGLSIDAGTGVGGRTSCCSCTSTSEKADHIDLSTPSESSGCSSCFVAVRPWCDLWTLYYWHRTETSNGFRDLPSWQSSQKELPVAYDSDGQIPRPEITCHNLMSTDRTVRREACEVYHHLRIYCIT